MVGRPNFPSDVDTRSDLMGESMPTPGLTALDQEREASMADEGGTSGAVMESQDGDTARSPTSRRPLPEVTDELRALLDTARTRWGWLLAGLALGGALVATRVYLTRPRSRGFGARAWW